MRLEYPDADRVQQGGIFNCVTIDEYDGCSGYGIIITARCDLAHAKSHVANYLPIVKFSDWISHDFSYILAEQLYRIYYGEIRNQLKSTGVSDLALSIYPLDSIMRHESINEKDKNLQKKVDILPVLKRSIDLAGLYNPDFQRIINSRKGVAEEIIKRLFRRDLPGYYFLEESDVQDKDNVGYVVLLRSVRVLQMDIAMKILKGIDKNEFDYLNKAGEIKAGEISVNTDDPFCMFTGVLRSPDIEHLLQTFSNLFSRVGVDDVDLSTIDRCVSLVKG